MAYNAGDRESMQPLLGIRDVRALARHFGISPQKKLGQNFVVDANTIRRIIRMADISRQETVLEIGPGLGSLTLGLLDAAAHVITVEVDPRLAAAIGGIAAQYRPGKQERLTIVAKDALRLGPEDFKGAGPTVLAANLPYNVAVPILLHLLELLPDLRRGVVMVQEEVADRIAAPAGNKTYGAPSAKAAWYGSLKKAGTVNNTVFWPSPRVSSGLVIFERRDPPSKSVGREEVFDIINAAFAHRRKTLRAALADWAGSAVRAERLLLGANIDPTVRGEKLGIEDFIRIAEQETQHYV